jgi:hypothetical protein
LSCFYGRTFVPRTNAGSRRFDENVVARRIGWELADREWTYQELATRMATVSCPMDQSAIHKIIKKGRRITVNELVAFSEVLDLSITELLVPLEDALSRRQNELLEELNSQAQAYTAAGEPMIETIRKIAALMMQTGYFNPRLMEALAWEERARVNLIDVALEAQAALTGTDLGEFPVPVHTGLSAPLGD